MLVILYYSADVWQAHPYPQKGDDPLDTAVAENAARSHVYGHIEAIVTEGLESNGYILPIDTALTIDERSMNLSSRCSVCISVYSGHLPDDVELLKQIAQNIKFTVSEKLRESQVAEGFTVEVRVNGASSFSGAHHPTTEHTVPA